MQFDSQEEAWKWWSSRVQISRDGRPRRFRFLDMPLLWSLTYGAFRFAWEHSNQGKT